MVKNKFEVDGKGNLIRQTGTYEDPPPNEDNVIGLLFADQNFPAKALPKGVNLPKISCDESCDKSGIRYSPR